MRYLQLIAFIFLTICTSTLSWAAEYNIHVEWGYTAPSEPAVTGYKLYMEGVPACEIQDPNATAIDCAVTTEKTTANFTLSAAFSDGTESPQSAPYNFVFVTETTPPPATEEGSHLFAFSWENNADASTISGFNIYLNNTLLCSSDDPTTTELSCRSDLLQAPMSFTITQKYAAGGESIPSNLLLFDPTLFPELYTTKSFSFSWDYPQDTSLAGFKIYQNGTVICETSNPADRTLTCTAELAVLPATFGITAVESSGTETALSNTLVYTGDGAATEETSENAPLQAVITASATSGVAPLSVSFASTASTGNIQHLAWSFGDGSTSDSSSTQHVFSTPGTYTVNLTLTDSTGATSSAAQNISVTTSQSDTTTTPPNAVLTSSTAVGGAPLTVTFDASASTAPDSVITQYTWDFGDGSNGSGASVSHTYTVQGSYTATIQVTNSAGLSDSASTPVLVTQATEETTNQAPQAVIAATPSKGGAPLTVSLSAAASTDPDGDISNYSWQFGDGSSASGMSVTHTYTSQANFTATLQVTDNLGAKSNASTTIAVQPEEETAPFNLETGAVTITNEWVRVPLSSTFVNPIVVAGPPSFNNDEPVTIRLRNVDASGFDLRLAEWDYQDQAHPQETVNYLVMEKGHFTLNGGGEVAAGSFAGTTSFKLNTFLTAFTQNPVLLTTVASDNESSAVSGRIRNVGASSFEYALQEQESNTVAHADETVHYIAWTPGTGAVGSLQYAAGLTGNTINNTWQSIALQQTMPQPPLIFAGMQTTAEIDPARLRVRAASSSGFETMVQEELSKDSETTHAAESIGYLALSGTDQTGEETSGQNSIGDFRFTFSWDYTGTQPVSSFRIYLNGAKACEINDPAARTTSCTLPITGSVMNFTITSVDSSGVESAPSNLFSFDPTILIEQYRKITFTWEYDQAASAAGFRMFVNETPVCETQDPAARELQCLVAMPAGETRFSVKALDSYGNESVASNAIYYGM